MKHINELEPRDLEALLVLQEECAEVTQIVSKIFRFGVDSVHPETGASNIERLAEEVGDVVAMIEILQEHGFLSPAKVKLAAQRKREKLLQWSNIFKEKK